MTGLDLPLGPQQQMLRDSLQRFLADNPQPGWRQMVDELGLGGIAVPEAAGGFGGGPDDIALVMAELGPALAGADWLSHAAATMLIAEAVPGHNALADLAAGRMRAAIICPASALCRAQVEHSDGGWTVHGTATLVAGAAEADLFVLADSAAILLIAAGHTKVERRARVMHDGSTSADLSFALARFDVELLADGKVAGARAAWIDDMMLAARCAEAVGLMQRMLGDSVDYLGQRRQFGTAIAAFQVLRHRVADMKLALMKATALTEIAVLSLDGAEREVAVSAACVEVCDAVRVVGEGAVQIHGAMGLTEELSLGRYFKRALAIAAAIDPAGQLARFAEVA